jgi:hypothetical protein
MKKFIFFVLISFINLPNSIAVSKDCGEFEMSLEGSEEQKELGRSLYRELYEELEVLSLEAENVDVCSFSCKAAPIEGAKSIDCKLHLKIEYSYIPLVGDFEGFVYCEESYRFDGESDYQVLKEVCDLSDFPLAPN